MRHQSGHRTARLLFVFAASLGLLNQTADSAEFEALYHSSTSAVRVQGKSLQETIALFPELNEEQRKQEAANFGISEDRVADVLRSLWEAQARAAWLSRESSTENETWLTSALRDDLAYLQGSVDVTNGWRFPSSLRELLQSHADPDRMSAQPGFLGIPVENFEKQLVFRAVVSGLAEFRPDLLIPFLQERSELSPVAADCVVYQMALNGFQSSSVLRTGRSLQRDKAVRSILALGRAQNPVYRLLAVEVAYALEPEQDRLVDFYRSLADEPDAYIQSRITSRLEQEQQRAGK